MKVQADKARRARIELGTISIDGFKDNNGEYFLSQSQVAEAVGVHDSSIRRFLESEEAKGLLGKGYTFAILEIEKDNSGYRGGNQIKAIPPQVASLFWSEQAQKWNRK